MANRRVTAANVDPDLEARINAVAMQVFDLYNTQMLRLYGTQYPRMKYERNAQQWKACKEIAGLCIDRQWDVELFVTEAVTMVHRNHQAMHPRALLHPKIVERFDREQTEGVLIGSPANSWQYYIEYLGDYIKDTGGTAEGLLFSPMTPFPAWFRVVYPEHVEQRTYDLYWSEARTELASQRGLRTFIRKHLPGRLEALEQRWGGFGDKVEDAV